MKWLKHIGWEVWLPLVLVLLWWLSSAASINPYFPPLRMIFDSFRENWLFDRIGEDIVPSVTRLTIAFAIAVVGGVGLGLLLGTVRWLEYAVRPIIEFLRATPGVAKLPIFMLMLGIGDTMKISIMAVVTTWPILLNTIDGVRSLEPIQRQVARGYHIGRFDTLRYIVLPNAAPQIFAGARTGLAICVVSMVIAEMVGEPGGIGHFILSAQRDFAVASMWSGILMLGILGYLINKGFALVEGQVLKWHRGMMAQSERNN